MFTVYERALGVTIAEEKGVAGYAPGVSLYDVRDAETRELLARFYFDPYPRPGKFRHEAIQVLKFAQQAPGGRRPALLALVMNIDPDLPGKPSHMAFDEVKTLFHEFGHIMHQSLGRARYRSLAHAEGDFVEAPAELFEHWVYEPEVLRLISVDPDHPGQPLPDEMLGRLTAARGFAAGLYWGGQLAYAQSDQTMHEHPDMDPDAMLRDGFARVIGYTEDPEEHWAASFLHAMGGKEALYYSYLWDEVLAADLYTRFKKEGVFAPGVGRDYRREVLEPAGTVPAREMVARFLGREFSEKAFLDEIAPKAERVPPP
jgi:thimet oligopeptidase